MHHDSGIMSWLGTIATLLATVCWPILLHDTFEPLAVLIVLLLNGVVAANTWYQCSSAECPFVAGLNTITGSMMSGGDKSGDWERAVGLYHYVQLHWPEEHGLYAENSIKEIERKRGLAGGQQAV